MKSLCLCIVCWLSVAWGQSFRIVPGATQQEASDSVRVTFKVLANEGQSVTSLKPNQVTVQENGFDVGQFSFAYEPLPTTEKTYIVLVLDASGSMRYDGKLRKLQAAAVNIVAAMSENEYCSIVTFSSKPRLLNGFTNDKVLLQTIIRGISARGYTAIYDAMWEAVAQVESQPAASPKIVLLISDGEEEGSSSLLRLDNIVPKLQSIPNLTIHTFDLNRKKSVNDLQRLASLGHGSYAHDPDPDKVFVMFERFLTENKKAYSLTFVPSPSDEPLRKVSVGLSLEGIDLQFESRYQYRAPGSLWKGSSFAMMTGALLLVGMGIVGAVAYFMRTKIISQRMAPRLAPLLVEAPRMAFDVFGPGPGDEKTRALNFEDQRDDEKTIIIEDRKKKSTVLGYLTVTDVNANTADFEIDSPEILFGRSTQCKAKFENMEVSRLHAKLRLEREGFVLYDLGSANGTYVNGEEVQKRLIRDGDKIEIGNNRIVFRGTNGHGEVSHERGSV